MKTTEKEKEKRGKRPRPKKGCKINGERKQSFFFPGAGARSSVDEMVDKKKESGNVEHAKCRTRARCRRNRDGRRPASAARRVLDPFFFPIPLFFSFRSLKEGPDTAHYALCTGTRCTRGSTYVITLASVFCCQHRGQRETSGTQSLGSKNIAGDSNDDRHGLQSDKQKEREIER